MGPDRSANARADTHNHVFPPLLDEHAWNAFALQHALTPRESEVLVLLTCGHSYDEICAQLGMSRPTLRTHLRSAYRKTQVGSRVELILCIVHRNHPG